MKDRTGHFGDDRGGFSHGLDEGDSMRADVDRPPSDAQRTEDAPDEEDAAERTEDGADPALGSLPVDAVGESLPVPGRRNPDLPTENLATPATR